MLTLIIIILAASFILYTLLGGADFGAGIIETLTGSKEEKTISKAIAPVWEANHVWLILAIVIIFTGFPLVYSTISIALHIPLMVVLLGIVLRGSSFVFRYYDTMDDTNHRYFTLFFKISSFITPFFLGISFAAMILGEINTDDSGSFYSRFILPWCNLFCFSMGLFVVSLFAYIAAVFLVGEAESDHEEKKYVRLSKRLMFTTFLIGLFVFLAAFRIPFHPLRHFFSSPLSIFCGSLVLLLTPVLLYLLNRSQILLLRVCISLQVTLIILRWFAIQFPVLVYEKKGRHLNFFNSRATDATLHQLVVALLVGLLLIVPAFYFLFKVFKKTGEDFAE